MKLTGRLGKLSSFLAQRITDLWNFLSQGMVMAASFDDFLKGLDKLMEDTGLSIVTSYDGYVYLRVHQ